ncbi:GHMP family kinase ATP-binding protein [Tardisphaera saccharovorans]
MSQGDFRYVVTKAPLRITFAGGGTDVPSFYREHGPGALLAATINRYIYVTVARNFYPDEYRISYSVTEDKVRDIDQIRHPTVRESLKLLGINKGVQIVSVTEIPSRGTGLGSSSAFLVALLLALHTWLGESVTPETLAREAYHVEREVLKEPGGKQDQYAAAYGGINLFQFNSDDAVLVRPVIMSAERRRELEGYLLLVFTGAERSSGSIHEVQDSTVRDHLEGYYRVRELAYRARDLLSRGDLEELGRLVGENWGVKKTFAPSISNPDIDEIYEKGVRAGAIGGKLQGAGGGGFMLFLVPPRRSQT